MKNRCDSENILAGLISMALRIGAIVFVVFAFSTPFSRLCPAAKARVGWWSKNLPFTGTRPFVIGIRILTADRRDDSYICQVRASMGTLPHRVTVWNGRVRGLIKLFSVLVTIGSVG